MGELLEKPGDVIRKMEEFAKEWKSIEDSSEGGALDERVLSYLKQQAPHDHYEIYRREMFNYYESLKK